MVVGVLSRQVDWCSNLGNVMEEEKEEQEEEQTEEKEEEQY